MRAAGDHADGFALRLDGGAVARDVAGHRLEPDQLSARALRFDALQGVAADEVAFVQLHGPSQAGLVWVDRFVHVVAPQTESCLEPGRIPGTEAGRKHACRSAMAQDGVPCFAEALAADEELEAVLARIAGARDQSVDPGHVALAKTKVRDGLQAFAPKQLLGPRALECDQAELEGAVLDLDVARRVLAKPTQVGLAVGCVHHDKETFAAAVDDEVVDDATRLVAEQVVLRLAV